MMNYTFVSATILLILITDPIGNIPIFANALKHVAPERRAKVILREILIAFALLLTFMFVGESFLRVMNLSELSLQIGGGVILFLIALRMVFPPAATTESEIMTEPLIVPLAVPAVAGPSALATVLLLVSQQPDKRLEWIGALCVTMLVSAVVLVEKLPIYTRPLATSGGLNLAKLPTVSRAALVLLLQSSTRFSAL